MAKLMPPVLADNFRLVNLIISPEMPITFLVEENGLEDVVLERDRGRELSLVVGAVKRHFQLGHVRRVGLDVVHWFEAVHLPVVTAGDGHPSGVVCSGKSGDGLVGGEKVFVVLDYVGRVGVGDG